MKNPEKSWKISYSPKEIPNPVRPSKELFTPHHNGFHAIPLNWSKTRECDTRDMNSNERGQTYLMWLENPKWGSFCLLSWWRQGKMLYISVEEFENFAYQRCGKIKSLSETFSLDRHDINKTMRRCFYKLVSTIIIASGAASSFTMTINWSHLLVVYKLWTLKRQLRPKIIFGLTL